MPGKPLRRKSTGLGPSRSSRPTRQSQDPDPLRIGHMLHELVEMAPSVVYPLEVMVGAHEQLAPHDPDRPKVAVFDLLDKETGQEYAVMVYSKSR